MTRHSRAPSKKLVPSLNQDRTCEHRFTDDDAMTLEIDCLECSGAQDIDNAKCASGIANVLASGMLPEAVVLKRFIHVRYRTDRIARLGESALALAALKRLEAQPEDASDKKCRTCPASRRRLAPEIMRRIRSDPIAFGAARRILSDRLVAEFANVRCLELRRCVAYAVWAGSAPAGGA